MGSVWLENLIRALLALLLGVTVGYAAVARADVISELNARTDSFVSPAFNSTSQSTYQFLGARFRDDPAVPSNFQVDLAGGYAVGAPLMSFINVKELAYEMPVNEQQTFTFGRKSLRWNELDRRWNFGLIEPVFEWNPLSPESQGLTGLFWTLDGDGYDLTVFGSGLFLPDQGPSFQIDDEGRFERGNAWFRRPPSSIRILGETTAIEYTLDRPVESEVVFQPSYGIKLDLGEQTPWRGRVALLSKPMNSLALGYAKGIVDIPKDRAQVKIQPKVAHHSVAAADVAYLGGGVSGGLSAIHDRPSRERLFDEDWNSPAFEAATVVSPWVDVRLAPGWKLSLQRIEVFGGQVTESGPDSSPDRAPINSRYAYTEANQVSLEMDRRLFKKRRLTLGASYLKSDRNRFDLFRTQGRFEINRLWSVQAEVQMVDAADEQTPDSRNDISEYANNDRVLLGVGYVF